MTTTRENVRKSEENILEIRQSTQRANNKANRSWNSYKIYTNIHTYTYACARVLCLWHSSVQRCRMWESNQLVSNFWRVMVIEIGRNILKDWYWVWPWLFSPLLLGTFCNSTNYIYIVVISWKTYSPSALQQQACVCICMIVFCCCLLAWN